MNPRVLYVNTEKDFKLSITFDNGEIKKFDVKPYLEKGAFKDLKDEHLFNTVKPFLGSIQWSNGLDFCPDTLYIEGESC